MLKGLLGKVVGDPNEREIRKLQPLVDAINELEPKMERRTDAELGALTDQFRARLAAGETLDDLLVEAFAAVREVAKRTVDMRPFDVQLIGGIVLHRGIVAEMRTGEGKTLVATMPVYLNALLGRGVHLVTVNDYLARRDALWMGPIYHLMGLSIGLLQSGREQPAYLYDPDYQRDPYPGLRPVPRKQAYGADITYGTNNEFGFDYLRDNIALSLERRVQRPLYYAIVDEVDNIFIDEARTPLIISGPSGEPVEQYSQFAAIARKLEPDVHYELDEKEHSVYLTDEGLAVVEQETGIENIYDEANYRYVHYMQQALKAQVLFMEGRDYIRQRKQIILIDQHTGRLMPSRRLSEGLHQAIEAKEAVPVRPRDVTSATVTIQNYFRMYEKLAGMSGTAVTEGEEFFKIYNLDVLAIPTNKPVVREDHADVVYRSEEAKLRAAAREILACHSRGQPVLVGTTSVEMSERLSKRLTGERLQMAALTPRIAYALQDADLDRDERARLRETMNDSLETMNSAAWRRLVRAVDLNPNALSDDNMSWIGSYLELPETREVRQAMERALRDGINHNILNAKEHTREAGIIAHAGEPRAVTIATNMAGRGVDIKLGGDLSDEVIHKAHLALQARGLDPFKATPAQMDSALAEVTPQYAKRRDQVLAADGLFVLGTERHEARRIDNQLRGRSGRQGEPGASRFYLSLEDDLMRRFGRREMLSKLMETIGDDFPIEHNLVSRTLERAQTSVEGHNFDIRKHLLEYDDVLNRQRETIYEERLRILQSNDLRAETWRMLEGQLDEYFEKVSEDPDQRRVLFAGLDDVVPLNIPAPNAPFQGPVAFGGHVTAFPPFTISFLADQFAGQPLEEVAPALQELAYRAAADYGEQIRQTVREIGLAAQEKYDERLERYQALLDEKIQDYLQLLEERGQPLEPRRLSQHLERTYPLRLTVPDSRDMTEIESLDDLRDYWLAEIRIGFHRQTCLGLIERIQIRLPADVRLDRLRSAQIQAAKLGDELRRVRQLAAKQARGDDARGQLERLSPPTAPTAAEVLDFVATVKATSALDFGRLDRLVGHVLGAYLDDLLTQYLAAVDDDQGRVRRDLERMKGAVVEGKRGGRGTSLPAMLQQLNDLVHLEIDTLEELLGLAVGHEYDKWAQRQLVEIEANARRNPLADTSWTAVVEHLLDTHYIQKQAYDRGHRRRTTWMPRLPFGFIAQAHVARLSDEALRREIQASLQWAVEQREQTWGQQELRRWGNLALDDPSFGGSGLGLDPETYDSLLLYLGEQELDEQGDLTVEDLPRETYDRLGVVLALRQMENRRLADLPQSETLLAHLGQALSAELLDRPLGELDDALQKQATEHLQEAGFLDDAKARANLTEQLVGDWERRTRNEVAAFLGQQFIEANQSQPVTRLEPKFSETAIAFLQRQRYFVDEARVQQFLVHQRLIDLPPETQQAALQDLAQTRLERLKQRKISNLDVKTRQTVTESLQRLGLFTDKARRDELLAASATLADLEPKVQDGFRAYLARERLENRCLGALDAQAREHVVSRLKQADLLAAPGQVEALAQQRLGELNAGIAEQVRDELASQLKADLVAKTMEELPSDTRQRIHHVLDEQNYFVDEERVGWYERKTLAQLSPDLLSGLELHLGRIRLDELAEIPFPDLPADTRRDLLEFFDRERLLPDRAAELRLTQAGSLSELPEDTLKAVVLHLGRQWLVQIRNQRPPALPEAEREYVWVYLRAQGHFADEFKEELFAYQRLDEFEPELQQKVEQALVGKLTSELNTQAVGNLATEVQAEVQARLREADYFVDEARLREVLDSSLGDLAPRLRQTVEKALGNYLLLGQGSGPIAELSSEVQAALWRYLDEIGYFIDEQKRGQILDRRLADLGNELYEALVQDLVSQLEAEIGDQPVSELDEEVRQGVRQGVEATGYFESEQERAQALARPLGNLRREDLESLATELGMVQLNGWADKRLVDLSQSEQEAILAHLQAAGWFLDRGRLGHLQSQPLRELEPDVRQELMATMQREQVAYLGRQRLKDLDRQQRRAVQDFLRRSGSVVEDGQMRSLRRQRVRDLDSNTYHDLLRDLGDRVVATWDGASIQDLDADQQALLSNYLGRRIMGRIERLVLLHTISRLWIDYLTDIEDLRRGIGLEAYGQRDPLIEYKRRAFELFSELGDNIRRTVVRSLFRQQPEPLKT